MKDIPTERTSSCSTASKGICALRVKLPIVKLYRADWLALRVPTPQKLQQPSQSVSAKAISHDHVQSRASRVQNLPSLAVVLPDVSRHHEAGQREETENPLSRARRHLADRLQPIRKTDYAISTQKDNAETATNARINMKTHRQDLAVREVVSPAAAVLVTAVSPQATGTSKTSCASSLLRAPAVTVTVVLVLMTLRQRSLEKAHDPPHRRALAHDLAQARANDEARDARRKLM